MANSIERLSELLIKGDSKKAALVFFGKNRRFFTEFPSSLGVLFVIKDRAWLLVDFRYAEAAKRSAKNCEVISFESMTDELNKLIKENGVSQVYLENETLSLGQANRFAKEFEKVGAEAVMSGELDAVIREIRMIKTPAEVAKIESAQAITDASFSHILPFIKEGMTEIEIALEIEFFMRKNGADGVAFEPIVVAGENSSLCHGVPSDNAVKKGDFITMDFGALLDGYHSDMTRTVVLGSVSDEQKAVYDTVLKAHLAAEAAVKPGIPCCDIDKVARDIIDENYSGAFGHGLGHGVGVEIHEWPRFSKLDSTPCAAGMVVTNEPGIYLAGKYGVRIEDMLLITDNGCRSLTNSPKDLIIL